MIHADDISIITAGAVALLLLLGSGLTLIGTIGLLRMRNFYERMHPPTLGATWGAGGILLASLLYFGTTQSRPVLHEILIAAFVTVTTPVTLMLLARAAIYRDRQEKNSSVPPRDAGQAGRSD